MVINIVLLLAAAGSVTVGLLVYLNNPKQLANKLFFGLALSTAGWTILNLLTNVSSSNSAATWFARTTVIPALFISYFVWLLSYYFPFKRKFAKTINIFFILIIALFIPLSLTPYNIVLSSPDGSTFETGIIYIATTSFFIMVLGYALINYLRMMRKAHGKDRRRVVFVVVGFFVTAILGFTFATVLPLVGVNSFLQVAPAVTIIMLVSFAYAMVRHRLFDLRAVVARSFAFIVSIGILAAVYGLVAFQIVSRFLPKTTNTTTLQIIYTVLAIILAFTFQPIRRFFEKISNAIFYRDKYDAQVLVNEVGRILAGEIQLEELCIKVTNELTQQMKVEYADIVVLSEKNVHFQTRVFSSEHHNILHSDLTKLGRLVVVTDELSGGDRKQVMNKYNVSVSLALRTSEEFLGYLLLGEKKSGDIYNEEDIRTLKIIANELSVAVQNAKAFAEIQAFNETLQAKVNDATKRLRHANSELKELDEAKDEFISIASHQLRTPLTTVKGYASMIAEGDFGKLTPKQKEPVTEILDGSERMNRLVGDLLNVSRIQAGKFYIDTVELDFERLVAGEVKQLEQLAKSKKVELVYKPPAKKLAPMMLDQNKTEQAVMNLIDNAIHYSASPGGGHVQVSLETHGNEVVFLVRDDGIGVPRDKQAKLFTKMFRAENAKEVRPDGTGLGLYLVKRVVEDEGGHVVFASEPGKGSTFGFRLPIGGVPKELQQKAKSIAKHVHLSV